MPPPPPGDPRGPAGPTGGGGGPATPDALTQLFLDHEPFVTRAITRLAGPYLAGEVDDLVQQVFAEAFQNRSRYSRDRPAGAWLYGIALRVVGSARRRARVRLAFRRLNPPADILTPSPAEAFEARESLAIVYRVLESMPEAKRTMWILSEIEELSAPEAASVLGITTGNARVRLFHARRLFQRILERTDADLAAHSSRQPPPPSADVSAEPASTAQPSTRPSEGLKGEDAND